MVTKAVASQVRGILLEAAAMMKLEETAASRCAMPREVVQMCTSIRVHCLEGRVLQSRVPINIPAKSP